MFLRNKKIIIILLSLVAIISLFFLFYNPANKIHPLDDLSILIEKASDKKFVLLGESSHGTNEYYQLRRIISQELINNHNYRAVFVEGDWDALYDINLYILHLDYFDLSAKQVLHKHQRWPQWMWVNQEFLNFIEWLWEFNQGKSIDHQVFLLGQDVYGLVNSMNILRDYLDDQSLYSCLLSYSEISDYVFDYFYNQVSCQDEVEAVYQLLVSQESQLLSESKLGYLNALQNALVVIFAEEHYRQNAYNNSWNPRAQGMYYLIENFLNFYDKKVIVWAHNTHVGDARATEMHNQGLLNIGQLLREKHGQDNVFILGFGTYQGTVLASFAWQEEGRVLFIPTAQENSWESYLAQKKLDDFFILFEEEDDYVFGHRAKGVVYNPANDRFNYVESHLNKRYDAFVFIKHTNALELLSP